MEAEINCQAHVNFLSSNFWPASTVRECTQINTALCRRRGNLESDPSTFQTVTTNCDQSKEWGNLQKVDR